MLKMTGITKQYPAVTANKNINLELKPGEVHALLGENGAGKSTLMNILSGVTQPTEGTIELYGEQIQFQSARDAIHKGIGMVYQHFMLIPRLTVAENIILGMKRKSGIFLKINDAAEDIVRFAKQYNIELDPHAPVETLTVGEQQRVEIIKALYRGAKILILDEPTAVLTPQEIDELFNMIRSFIASGCSVIFISHKMDEVLNISDRISILRRGELVETLPNKDVSREKLAGLMVGRQVSFKLEKKPVQYGREMLKLVSVNLGRGSGCHQLSDINFSLSQGEILGVAGVDGNGQSELLEVITGLRRASSGTVLLNAKEIHHRSPREIMEMGLAHIPEDRHVRGLVLDLDIKENFMVNDYHKNPHCQGNVIDWSYVRNHSQEFVESFDVRSPSLDVPVSSLSGGNQQKLVLARELHGNPLVIAAMHATRGLDIGAIEYVHTRMLEQRDKGAAILYISTELEELMNISDRLMVMCRGKIVGIVDPSRVTIEQVGLMMTGHPLE